MELWKLTAKRVLYQSPWATVELNCYSRPAGEVVAEYLVIKRRPFVLVVAESDRHEVLLIRQYRPATERSYLCLPAGYIQDDESTLAAAQRELLEETGFSAHSYQQISVLDPLPGYVVSPAHVVRCVLSSQITPTDPDSEVQEVLLMPWHEVLSLIKGGVICEMQAAAALLLVALEREGPGA